MFVLLTSVDCVAKVCLNGGAQDPTTCDCLCLPNYTGDICESECLIECITFLVLRLPCISGYGTCSKVHFTYWRIVYDLSVHHQPIACVLKNCTNGGTQDPNTCDCVCPLQYNGEFCESECHVWLSIHSVKVASCLFLRASPYPYASLLVHLRKGSSSDAQKGRGLWAD